MDVVPRFFNDIIAEPADATPRLIYADWLEEQGNLEAAYWRLPLLGELHARLVNLTPDHIDLTVVPIFESAAANYVWSYRFSTDRLWRLSRVWREAELDLKWIQFIVTEIQWDLEAELFRAAKTLGNSDEFEIPF